MKFWKIFLPLCKIEVAERSGGGGSPIWHGEPAFPRMPPGPRQEAWGPGGPGRLGVCGTVARRPHSGPSSSV